MKHWIKKTEQQNGQFCLYFRYRHNDPEIPENYPGPACRNVLYWLNKIFQIFGHSIDLQPDFKLIKADSLNSFVWVGRGYPYRWLTLHRSRKDSYLDIKSSWDQLKNDFSRHMPKITISNHYQENEKAYYGNNKIPIMRGIYEHSESDTGGPFFVYIFDTEQTNEVILISGFVNYPGHEKLLLLKQLEIIAKTLHKGDTV